VFQVLFQIVQDARVAGLQNLREAAPGERSRIAWWDSDRAECGTGPIGRQLAGVAGKKRASDSLIWNQSGKTVENPAQNIFHQHALLDRLDQIEKLPQLPFSPGQRTARSCSSWPSRAKGSAVYVRRFGSGSPF